MLHDGSRLPPGWGSWLALFLWSLLFFYLLGAVWPAHAQTQSERLASIERELINSLVNCQRLSIVLREQSGRVASLQSSLDELRESLPIYESRIADLESELKASQALSADLSEETSRLRELLASLQAHLDALSLTFERYKKTQEVTINLLERQVTVWKVGTVVAAALAVAASVWALTR